MRGWRLGIFIGLAVLIWYWRWQSGTNPELQSGQHVRIISQISQQPTIKIDQFTDEEYQWVWATVGSEIFGFRAERWEEIEYGDRVEVVGILEGLTLSERVKPWQISPRRWMIKKAQVGAMGSVGHIGMMAQIRADILTLFRHTLPRDEAGLLSGMVLGSKGELSENFKTALQKSGTIHVVVASGFNVMLVAGTLASILVLWVRRSTAVILGIMGIWAYVGLVGLEAPVVRAGIMGSLAFIGIATGRVRDTGWLLIISAVLMLWWRPSWLWDVGFQLSVAATAGLIWIEPVLRRKAHGIEQDNDRKTQERQIPVQSRNHPTISRVLLPLASGVLGSLTTTLAAQIAVLPILLHTFGEISLWSPLVNALVLWVVPLVTGAGMVVGVLHLTFGSSACPVGCLLPIGVLSSFSSSALWFIWPLLKYFVIVVEWFGIFGTLHWQLPWWVGLAYYVVLVFWVRFGR